MRIDLCFEKPRIEKFEAKECKICIISLGLIRFLFYNRAFREREADLFRRIMYSDQWYAGHSQRIKKEVEKRLVESIESRVGQIEDENKKLKERLADLEEENMRFRSLKHFIIECSKLLTNQ